MKSYSSSSLAAVEDEADAGIDVGVVHARKRGHVATPALGRSQQVVAATRQQRLAGDGRTAVGADEPHPHDRRRRAVGGPGAGAARPEAARLAGRQDQHGFGRRQEHAVAATAGQELHRAVGLAVVRLEGQGQWSAGAERGGGGGGRGRAQREAASDEEESGQSDEGASGRADATACAGHWPAPGVTTRGTRVARQSHIGWPERPPCSSTRCPERLPLLAIVGERRARLLESCAAPTTRARDRCLSS
jgi:hypothetical protein